MRLVEQTTASWEFYFGLLQRFVEREGHARVPQATPRGRLSSWQLGHQPAGSPCAGNPHPDRERPARPKPARMGHGIRGKPPGRTASPTLEQFVQRERHARVPVGHREDGYRLGQWMDVQRRLDREGRLDRERCTRLEALPGWTWVPDDAWEEGFAYMQRFVEREGRANVPRGTVRTGSRSAGGS